MGIESPPGPGTVFRALITALRPSQWVKNSLVFAALIFSRQLTIWDAIWHSLVAFAIMCLASSGIYLLNDLRDRQEDRQHPKKKHRPLAAGTLPVPLAAAVMLGLILISAATAAFLR